MHVPPKSDRDSVRLWSRLGNDKTAQFPSIVRALDAMRATLRGPLLIDAEIVALDEKGNPAGFQRLQGRIHLTSAREVEQVDKAQPVAIIAFDLLRDGDDDLRGLPLTERRTRLESHLRPHLSSTLRISEQVADDGKALHARALGEGWEGLIVKEASAPYQSGRRSPAWRKLKVLHEQEFVVGGWTEPRQTRQHFGALLLGVHDEKTGALTYVGHTGTGFDQAELERVWKLLKPREIPRSPFAERPKTNETAHWVRPELVVQVRFTEWTADARLRHPVYLGLRDDKRPQDVRRETVNTNAARMANVKSDRPRPPRRRGSKALDASTAPVVAQLRALEDARRDGTIELPGGDRLGISNPAKVFWPQGEADQRRSAPLLRGSVAADFARRRRSAARDEAISERRDGPAFYQQRKRLEQPPPGVRIETIAGGIDPILEGDEQRFVGGSLITLLYMTQIAAISQDPWFSRVQSPLDADYAAIDLDPDDRHAVSPRARRGALGARRARGARRAGGAEDVRIERPAHLRAASAGHVVRVGPAVLPDRRHGYRSAGTRRWPPSSAPCARGRAARSTSIFCRTFSARRWRPPTARAPATSRACRRR